MAFLTHVTAENDRWDLLAWRYYGDALGYECIIQANPNAPIEPVLPAGLTIHIPILEAAEVTAPTTESLPPWLR